MPAPGVPHIHFRLVESTKSTFGAETSILAYRKDIFEEQGIEVPTTYDELLAAMNQLHDAGIPALTSRGATGHQVTAAWLFHLAPLGGRAPAPDRSCFLKTAFP